MERSVSTADARRRQVTLTEKGATLQADCHRLFLEAEELMLRGLTTEEQAALFGLLRRVIANLEEDRTT